MMRGRGWEEAVSSPHPSLCAVGWWVGVNDWGVSPLCPHQAHTPPTRAPAPTQALTRQQLVEHAVGCAACIAAAPAALHRDGVQLIKEQDAGGRLAGLQVERRRGA